MSASATIRHETPADIDEIRDLTRRAFAGVPYGGGNEQDIIDVLRARNALAVSLVAEHDGRVAGHVAFSPAVASDGTPGWFTLGPVSVEPTLQRKGIGCSLINAGLDELRASDAAGCIVVGDTSYYSRFGFIASPQWAPAGTPKEHYMVLCFSSSAPAGAIDFHPAFYGQNQDMAINTAPVVNTLATLFSELIHGAHEYGYMLNGGDAGLAGSLDKVTAEAASAPTATGSTIAAHIDHVRYGLSLMNRWSAGENPFATADWAASWRRTSVSGAEWEKLRGELRDESERWLASLHVPREVTEIELNGMMASIAHLAYHFGAIRQIDATLRGPKEGE